MGRLDLLLCANFGISFAPLCPPDKRAATQLIFTSLAPVSCFLNFILVKRYYVSEVHIFPNFSLFIPLHTLELDEIIYDTVTKQQRSKINALLVIVFEKG